MPKAPSHETVRAAIAASTGQLLFRCARLVNERALARVRARFGVDIRPAHTALFPHLALEGIRQTELAKKVGVSKQAVHQLVAELEAMGVLERVPDPADARATLVRFAFREGADLFAGLAVLGEIEDEMRAVIGPKNMVAFHRALERLDAWLSSEQ